MSLELRGVSLQVGGETHIYDTNIELQEKEFNILLGTTLSGKTTLMRLMAGLEKPSRGEVWFKGKNVTTVPVQKRNVAFVYQQFINYPNFTVFDNIASPLRVLGQSKAEISAAVNKVADLLKLGPLLQRYPSELSGGQQQRTALARALVKQAELVLLDEPLANLDYKLREELRSELPPLFSELGTTVVYATSEPSEALMLGGSTATLLEGRVVEFARTDKLYQQPSTIASAEVFSDPPINFLPVRKIGSYMHFADTAKWALNETDAKLEEGDYTLGVRPHHLTLEQCHERSVKLSGTTIVSEISGSESIVHVDIQGTVCISQNRGVYPIEIAQPMELYLQSDRCLIYDQNNNLVNAWHE